MTKRLSAKERKLARERFLESTPAPVVVLAIDAAATSGWAVMSGAGGQVERIDSGLVDVWGAGTVEAVIGKAVAASRKLSAPLYAGIEYQAAPYGGRDVRAFAGVCEARGPWKRQWRAIISGESDNPRVGRQKLLATGRWTNVPVTTWRSMIFGPQGKMGRAEYKALAMELVRSRFTVEATDDEAEAILIGEYLLRIGVV